MKVFLEHKNKKLCNSSEQHISPTVSVSLLSGLTLKEYTTVLKAHCVSTHNQPCADCSGMEMVARDILDNGYAVLSASYRKAFPTKQYKADIAKRLLLQMH